MSVRLGFVSALALGALALASCRSYDPEVFDSRLRAATFDAYVEQIERQHGGLERAGIGPGELAERYRGRAIAARDPVEFYRVIADVLLDLDDPHVDLVVSELHWPAIPLGGADGRELEIVAEPFDVEFVAVGDDLYVGYSAPQAGVGSGSGRAPRLGDGWSPLVRELLATESGPAVRWRRVVAIDGRPMAARRAPKVLLRGTLLSELPVVVVDRDGRRETVRLPRNGGRMETMPGVVSILSPRALARELEPEAVALEGPRPGRVQFERPPFRSGQCVLPSVGPSYVWRGGLEAWRLGRVGYLRVGTFRLGDDPERDAEEFAAFTSTIDRTFADLDGCDTLILDLTENHGGKWVAMGHLVSHFLPPSAESVPHVGRRVEVESGLFVTTTTTTTEVLPRAPVEPCRARRIVVLVDQWTTSAAEIAAAAVRGTRDAVLVGDRTAGAEYMVHDVEGPDGSSIRFGSAGGMTGGCEHFQGVGLMPDVRIPMRLEILESKGFAAAREQHRREILAAGLRAAGLDPIEYLGWPSPDLR